ncbi:thioester reductase domain-containing protein [Streptomyces sp. NPDC001415]
MYALLTGATGFLGSRLCTELLRRTDHQIVCLVRAPSDKEAEHRLRATLSRQAPDTANSDRLRFVTGDFTQPCLGLDAPTHRQLARRVTEVYHCGAAVNMGSPYEVLAPVNVAGTAQVLQFCRLDAGRRLHHVSTLGVFIAARKAGLATVPEDAVPTAVTCSEVGYPRSKYEAELLVREAATEGLPVRVYRPAVVLADSRTGVGPEDDFTGRLITAMVATGRFPHTGNVLRVITVDHAARAIAALSIQPEGDGHAWHLTSGEPFACEEFYRQARTFGYPITPATAVGWASALKELGQHRSGTAMRALLGVARYLLGLTDETLLPDFHTDHASTVLTGLGVTAPALDDAYFARLFTHLIDQGIIPAPPRSGGRHGCSRSAATGPDRRAHRHENRPGRDHE